MINIKKILNKYNIEPTNITYRGKAKIIDTEYTTYVVRLKQNNNQKIYKYLEDRNFNNFLPIYNSYEDPYEIYPFIVERQLEPKDKAQDLVYMLSLLHNKTTTYENVDLDEVKNIYETTIEKLDYLDQYYHDLQDNIESKVYMAPAEYLLIRNITSIYSAIYFSKEYIKKWHDEKTNQKTERRVFLHNNLYLHHFLLGEDNSYFINWENSKRGNVIYDFLSFYRNEYLNIEPKALFDIYQAKFLYTKDEKTLFFALLAFPWKIAFQKSNYINTIEVRNLIKYIDMTNDFISEKNEENQKAHQEKFN